MCCVLVCLECELFFPCRLKYPFNSSVFSPLILLLALWPYHLKPHPRLTSPTALPARPSSPVYSSSSKHSPCCSAICPFSEDNIRRLLFELSARQQSSQQQAKKIQPTSTQTPQWSTTKQLSLKMSTTHNANRLQPLF